MQLGNGDMVLYAHDRERLFGRIVDFHERTGMWRIDRWCGGKEFDWVTDREILTSDAHERRQVEDVVRRDVIDGEQITTLRWREGEEERFTVNWQTSAGRYEDMDFKATAHADTYHRLLVNRALEAQTAEVAR